MTKEIKKPFRKFLAEQPIKPIKTGDLEKDEKSWLKYKEDVHFYDAHLRGYLKGWTRFPYKQDEMGNQKYHPVQQEYLNKEK